MQKHRIKTLYCNRQALEKKAGLSLFSREATKLSQELQRRRAEGTQIIIIIIIIIINSLTHLYFIDLFSSVYWSMQLHSCMSVSNKLTYLLSSLPTTSVDCAVK